jgi:hypothetical protein
MPASPASPAPPLTASPHPRWTRTALTAFIAITASGALAAWPAAARAELPPLPPAGVEPLGGDAPGDVQRSYDDTQLAFDEELDVVGGSGVRRYRFFVGKYRHEIAMVDFLHRVGRDDLVAETTHRRHIAIGLGVAGGLAILAGADGCKQGPGMGFDGACIATGVGAIALGSGAFAAALIVGSYRAAPPEDMRRMADEYNARLRGKLGGGASAIVTPYLTRDGGGGVLTLQF